MNGNDAAPIYALPMGTGFDIRHGAAHFAVYTRDHPMVVDTDTYWFGAFSGRYNFYFTQTTDEQYLGDDSACALSWQNRIVPGYGSLTLSVVMTWIGSSSPPVLDMTGTVVPGLIEYVGTIDFHGTVTDDDGDLVSVFVIVDDDYSRLIPILSESQPGGFSRSISVRTDLEMTIGAHTLKVYAVDQTGTVARNVVSYPIEVSGPTASPHGTPAKTVTGTHRQTPTSSSSPYPTRTLSRSPAPTATPYPYFIMEESAPGWNSNFNIVGRTDDADQRVIQVAYSGFRTLIRDDLGFNYYLYNREPQTTTSNLLCETHITLVGAAAVCVFAIHNQAEATQSVSVALSLDLLVNGADNAPCYEFAARNGFYAMGEASRLNFYVASHPLVVDADTYWFGPYQNWSISIWNQSTWSEFSGADSAMSMSWQNRPIAPGQRLVLSTVLTWGLGSSNPTLNVGSMSIPNPINWEANFTVSGTATDPEGRPLTIIIVADGDYSRLKKLGNYIASGAAFSYQANFRELEIRGGEHLLEVMAIEITGAVSTPSRFIVNVAAPTLPVTNTLRQTPARTSSAGFTRSRSQPATRTPWQTPPPLPTPPSDLRMGFTGDVDPHTNFRLFGEGASLNGDLMHISNNGFNSRYQLSTGAAGRLARLETVDAGDVRIGTRVQLIGASAVVAYELRNFGGDDVLVNMSLDTDVNLAENDDAPIVRLVDGSGFRVEGGLTHLRVYTSGYPLVVDADAFWFGSFFDLEQYLWAQTGLYFFAGDDSAFAISWQNRVIPAGGRLVLSSVLTWYGDWESPTLNMGSTSLPESIDWRAQFTLSGTVSAAEQLNLHLIMVLNNDFGNLHRLGDDLRSGTAFSYAFTAEQLRLERGKHSFDIYAFDTKGAVSSPITFTMDVHAPTVMPTHTPAKTATKAATFKANTPDPTLGPGDDAGANSGSTDSVGGDRNAGAKAAIGVILAIAIVIFLVVGYLFWKEGRSYGMGAGLDSAVDIDSVGTYTI
jgi:hypothetical protein